VGKKGHRSSRSERELRQIRIQANEERYEHELESLLTVTLMTIPAIVEIDFFLSLLVVCV